MLTPPSDPTHDAEFFLDDPTEGRAVREGEPPAHAPEATIPSP